MNFKKNFIFILLSSSCFLMLNGQSFDKDLLSSMPYEKLRELFFNYQSTNETHNFERQPNDSIAEIYANAYLERAKKEKDTYRIARGFGLKSLVSDFQNAIEYCDSIIEYSGKFNHVDFPAFGFMQKGFMFYLNDNNSSAIAEYLKARELAFKKNNTKQLVAVNQFIGIIKSEIGDTKQAKIYFNEQLKILKGIPNYKESHTNDYLFALDNLSKNYLHERILDSAEIMINEAIKLSIKTKDTYMYSSFLLSSGNLLYFQGDYSRALDSLKKAEPMLTSNSLAMCYYYQGKIFQIRKNDNSLSYFKKVDSIYTITKYPFEEYKNVYRSLFDYYNKKGNTKTQLFYLEKLISVDSVLNVTYKDVNNELIENYEIPKLIDEKNRLLNKIEKESSKKLIWLGLISLLVLIAFVYYYLRQKRYKRLYEKLIRESINKEKSFSNVEELTSNTNLDISENIINEILSKLSKFENDNEFLDRNISLKSLAKQFNSNTSYVSKIINRNKGTSFTNYLNSLRINYVVEELKTNSILRPYTIEAIAKEVGFNNAESFSKAFKKSTGIKPSYFIKQLNKQ